MEIGVMIERGLALLWRASWQASVLALIVILVQFLLGKRLSPQWRHALWLLVVVRLLLPITPPSPWSLFNIRIGSSVQIAESQAQTSIPSMDAPAELSIPRETPTATPKAKTKTPEAVAELPNAKPEGSTRSIPQSALTFLKSHLGWVWFLGALALTMRLGWGNYLFGLQLRRRQPISDSAVLDLMKECRSLMGVRRPLTLIEAPELDSPALFGCFRLKLLLPESMIEKFSTEELRHVFLHELAHIRRGDAVLNWLTTLLQTLHWFNPVIWLAFRRMRADREVACDEMVLARTRDGESKPYGQTVIKVLEGFTKGTAIPGLVGILEEKQEIKRRIKMIAQFKKTSPWPVQAVALLIALGLISLTDGQTKKGGQKLIENRRSDNALANHLKTSDETLPDEPKPVFSGLTFRRLMDIPEDIIAPRQVSFDGRKLIGIARRTLGNPLVLDLGSGAQRRYAIKTTSFRLSPDGTGIAAGLRDPDHWPRTLGVLNTTTEDVRELYRCKNKASSLQVAGWSPDGHSILVELFEQGKQARIANVSAGDGTMTELIVLEPEVFPSGSVYSPDGQWIAYNSNQGVMGQRLDIHSLSADGTTHIPLVQHPANDLVLGWERSGSYVLFASDRRGDWDAYTIEVAGGKAVGEPRLVKMGIGKVNALGITQKGTFFYSSEAQSSDVYIAPLDPTSWQVTDSPIKATRIEGRNRYPDWSKDGQFLAFVYSPYDSSSPGGDLPNGVICIRDLRSGEVRELGSDAGRLAFPKWFPDNRSLFAAGARNGKAAAFRIDAETGKSTLLTEEMNGLLFNTWCLWLAPNGKSFYQQASLSKVVQFNFETRISMDYPVPRNLYTVALSPDEKWFAYSVTSGESSDLTQTINIVPRQGGESRTVAKLTGPEVARGIHEVDNALGWTPDSRNVLFVKANRLKPRVRSLWRTSVSGGESQPLGLEFAELREPVISPDGRNIAFTAGGIRRELWAMENFLPKDDVAVK